MQFNIDQIKKIVELVGAQKRPTRNATSVRLNSRKYITNKKRQC